MRTRKLPAVGAVLLLSALVVACSDVRSGQSGEPVGELLKDKLHAVCSVGGVRCKFSPVRRGVPGAAAGAIDGSVVQGRAVVRVFAVDTDRLRRTAEFDEIQSYVVRSCPKAAQCLNGMGLQGAPGRNVVLFVSYPAGDADRASSVLSERVENAVAPAP